jgi:FKBP-type peptidyl-prolyl cis-trans isomerase (trigger factor)
MTSIFRKFAISYIHGRLNLKRCRSGLPAWAAFIACFTLCLVPGGCSRSDAPAPEAAVLIRSDRQSITMGQFERAFAAARIAYSDNRDADPWLLEEARVRLANQMSEELIIARHAEELGIALDERELEAAIQAIKKDYPDDEFDQMLLESAIPYSLWKDRLRTRLLMEKVIDRDLVQSLDITAEEIETYYKAHEEEFSVNKEEPPEGDLKHRIVEELRREKVEAAYPKWMEGLRKRYQVKINWKLLEQTDRVASKTADRSEDKSP